MILTPRGLFAGGRRLPCTIGRTGASRTKREGDGATPAGQLSITGALYRADRMARPVRWARPIGPQDAWSDDPGDPSYNTRIRLPHAGASHERLRRSDRLYDLILLTDWNARVTPGRGSAIFVHRWRRRCAPTEGCIAMAPSDLAWLAQRLRRGDRILVRAGTCGRARPTAGHGDAAGRPVTRGAGPYRAAARP